ncbi:MULTISPECIES: response regulator [Streptomyces]|uniref:response regulator n=1 Tax=Streptomyces TaxID=1883 RepID=UPI001F15512A|nr:MULTISPECIES: response regulator [Streptomyces]
MDDDEKNLLVMRAVLETLDQEIVSVDSGREALKALLDHDDFAVIIMDVQMPEMDGYETAAQIKRRPRNRDVPIIFLTAMIADPEHVRLGYAARGCGLHEQALRPLGPASESRGVHLHVPRPGAPLRPSADGACGCWRQTAGRRASV